MSNLRTKYKLEESQEKQFSTFLKSFETASDTTFTVFDHGEFYTTHGKNATFAAKEIFKNTSTIKVIGKGDKSISTVYLSQNNFESLAKELLLVRYYRLEIYRNKSKTSSGWELLCKASPGNLVEVEGLLFKNIELTSASSGVIAVRHFQSSSGSRNVAIGFIDTTIREMCIAEFEDNEVFSNVESTIIQLGARECLLLKLDQSSESSKLSEIVKRSGILVSERSRKEFDGKNLFQDLNRIVKKNKKNEEAMNAYVVKEISDKENASGCLAACVHYLGILNNEDYFDQFTFRPYDLSQYMRLDRSAYAALNLFSTESSTGSMGPKKTCDSLYNLLDQCKTPQGRRLLSQWIKQPLLDINHIQERLDLVEAFVEDTTLRLSVADEQLRCYPDLCRMSKKFYRKKSTLQDCYKVYQGIKSIPHLCECLTRDEGPRSNLVKEYFTTPLHEISLDFGKFSDMLETTLDFRMIEQHEFRVKADFDPELLQLQERMDEIKDKMDKCFSRAAGDLMLEKGKTIKLECNAQFGYFFRVTCKEERNLRNKKQFCTLDTTKAGVRFVTEKLSSLSESYKECQTEYGQKQLAIVNEIIGIASGYSDLMLQLGDVIAKLDVLVSFAQVAVNAPEPFVKPTISALGNEGSGIHLKECRHPCLERQDDVAFIPNDIDFDRESNSFLIVTGPNMGGKSTYIRQAGMVVLMAQIGCFLPCREAHVTVVDAILARVGAGDCQVRGVSTFMAEMLETSSILRSATKNSLVIIDELGRGTSTYDGFGLAWAISHQIATVIGAYCVFATHFHELTALADEVPSVANFHVTALTSEPGAGDADEAQTLTMLYQVRPGVCDQSFGIHVAECVNFPKRVIESAKRKAAELEDYCVTLPGDQNARQNDPESARKRRKLKLEGEECIGKFLSDVRAKDWSGLSLEEAKAILEDMKKEVVSQNNPYVMDVVGRANMIRVQSV